MIKAEDISFFFQNLQVACGCFQAPPVRQKEGLTKQISPASPILILTPLLPAICFVAELLKVIHINRKLGEKNEVGRLVSL